MPFRMRSRFRRFGGRTPREPVSWIRDTGQVTGSATLANAIELFNPVLVTQVGQDLRVTIMRTLLEAGGRARGITKQGGGQAVGDVVMLHAGVVIDNQAVTNAGDLANPALATDADTEADWMWLGRVFLRWDAGATFDVGYQFTSNVVNQDALVDIRAKRKLSEDQSLYLVTRLGPFVDGTAVSAATTDLQSQSSILWQRTMRRR